MAYIPETARWYVADVVLEHLIEGDPRNLVYVNTYLVEADSPEFAYEKAMAIGMDRQDDYVNTDGKQVRVLFRGLRELNVVDGELRDGVELTYTESVAVPEDELREWTQPKERLAIFLPTLPRSGPNCMPESVMRMLEECGLDRDELRGND